MLELDGASHITAGINVLLAGLQLLIHFYAVLGKCDARALQVHALHRRATPDRDKQRIAFDVLAAIHEDQPRVLLFYSFNIGPEPESDSFLLENPAEDRRCLRVRGREQTIQTLEDNHVRTESAKRLGQLSSYRTAADDQQPPWQTVLLP
jgi:hypothetical protein